MDGKWEFTVHTFMGDMRSHMEFKVDGDVLTGTGTDASNGACAEIQNGKFDGTNFSYTLTVKTAVGEMTNEINGVLDGDNVTGKSKNPMGEFDLTGVRQ